MRLNGLDLFAGIGGLALGMHRAGIRLVGLVEADPWRRQVLGTHWPGTPLHDDVATAGEWWRSADRPQVHIVSGGYPCQGESHGGRRGGTDDHRWKWPDMARFISGTRPWYVLGENTIGHRKLGLRFVLRDLAELGYVARAGTLDAAQLGAPHGRRRIFILATRADIADAHRIGRTPHAGIPGPRCERCDARGRDWWRSEPRMGRVADGVPGGMDRVRALGDAAVPTVAEHAVRLLLSGASVLRRCCVFS